MIIKFKFVLVGLLLPLVIVSQSTYALKQAPLADTLENFSAHEVELITSAINFNEFDGVIPAKLVTTLFQQAPESATLADLMLKFLPLASRYALPVTSDFYVGAIAQGESGALYLGSNLEIANEDLGNSIHAEQSAINNALLHAEQGINRIAITAAPCGHCRQFLNEIKDASDIEIIVLGNEPTDLKTLLPSSFGPVDLGSTTPLFVRSEANQNLCETIKTTEPLNCSHSYAPHTNSPSAVVLKASPDIIVTGAYIENAAYNPSLSPLMSALDQLKYRQSDFSQIQEVILLEREGGKISQRTHIKSLLRVIAPLATFKTVAVPPDPIQEQ